MGHKGNPRTANGHRRRQLRDRVKSMGLPCAICGQPIDYSRPYSAADPYCWVLDEIYPVSKGGDPLDFNNVQALHNRCNQLKGAKVAVKKDCEQHKAPIPHSRVW